MTWYKLNVSFELPDGQAVPPDGCVLGVWPD